MYVANTKVGTLQLLNIVNWSLCKMQNIKLPLVNAWLCLTETCLFPPQPGGFTVEAVNNNSSMVMTGMRVQVGTQAIERAPSYVEVFGRTMQINLARARWFDFPFTREEALQADKKLSIFSKSAAVDWIWSAAALGTSFVMHVLFVCFAMKLEPLLTQLASPCLIQSRSMAKPRSSLAGQKIHRRTSLLPR